MIEVEYKLFPSWDPQFEDPRPATKGSVGFDLRFMGLDNTYGNTNYYLVSNKVYKIDTGIGVAIPEGYEGQVRLRSSLALKGMHLLNGPGTIDPDYRGEISVIAAFLPSPIDTRQTFYMQRGMRIAQLVFAPVVKPNLIRVSDLSMTHRGTGGFGSTGEI